MKIKYKLMTSVLIFLLASVIALGFTWQFTRLSWNSGFSGQPFVAANGKNVYVTWSDNTPGSDIFLNMSHDGGKTWKFKNLSYNNDFSIFPSAAVNGKNVYVVWSDGSIRDKYAGYAEIFFKTSNDSGNTWKIFKRLSYDYNNSMRPSIAVDSIKNKSIYVVWYDEARGAEPKNNEIYLNTSHDGGKTWKFKRLTYNSGNSQKPSIAAYNGSVYVVWQDNTYRGFPNTYIKISNDSGKTWTTQRLTNVSSYYAGKPRLAIYKNHIYVIWVDRQVFIKSSHDSGKTWKKQQLSFGSVINPPSITTNGGNVFVTWINDKLYISSSYNYGNTWQSEIISQSSGVMQDPSMASNGKNVYIAWEDSSPGNSEIFFKAGYNTTG